MVTGPNVMMGYWNNEEATKEVIIEPGTFRTGDLGKLSDDGYLSITGRIKSSSSWRTASTSPRWP